MELFLQELATPIGLLRVVDDGAALRAIEFEDYEPRLHAYLRTHCGAHVLHIASGPVSDDIRLRLLAYFQGELAAIDPLQVRTAGTAFQRRIWQALRQIPAGTTWSYGQLAAHIGAPTASRAVGMANGANPVPIVVPCHRVIGANGTLTGFGGGLPRKKWLLAHEAEHAIQEVGLATTQTQLRML